ncbi:Wide host range VirA protein [Methylobacterium crusticola]|uniref:histidine kinase n=1 Tax=Methylobacterium crusticola TaxID=1697972 RepID=A0ABQ4RA81_9HYPH|nr:two-component system VirA-like sensor kinase [Methylobacterium crusticola]GJD53689.1 Wide host range VirA protein [Methylobacterium crusticola]
MRAGFPEGATGRLASLRVASVTIGSAFAVAVPLLLLLLTWLSFRAVNADAEIYDRALQGLDRFTAVQSALQRDVLTARAGLLRNYDPLVGEIAALHGVVAQMREVAQDGVRSAAAIDALAASVARQDALVERFKTENALLQNSLAYFGLFSARLRQADDARVLPALSDLAAAMLRLTLDTSSSSAREVEDRLRGLAAQPGARDDAAVQALLAHGRLLHRLLPSLDGLLRALLAVPSERQENALRAMVLAHQSASRETARRSRLLLYATSVVLVAALVHLGFRLRSRARALRRRAALEHAIAGVSMRFINAPAHEVGLRIEEALAALAALVGADRAYFVLADREASVYSWARDPEILPPGWPERALALAAEGALGEDGLVHLPALDRLPAGPGTLALAQAGIRGWACVTRTTNEGAVGILGFDGTRSRLGVRRDELGLLRMAFDVLANAVGRTLLERDRAQLEARLQQARRMETVGALTSGIAHNFNNIVGAILGYAEMAETQAAAGSRITQYLGEIRRAGERARDLIDQILTFGRRRDARRHPVRVQALLAEAISLLRASLPATVDLVLHDAPGEILVSGEPAQLQQVVLNLCSNAAQAMDGVGRVEIDTGLRRAGPGLAPAPAGLPPGCYVRIAVRDAGHGMDEATRDRIFEPFFTTRPAGNGLGLATVREIVREHGGTIEVASRPGAGSRFDVWLPCAAGSGEASGTGEPALPLGRGQTLLVINPHRQPLLRDEEVLAALGYEPVGFAGMEPALAACRAAPERFAAIVVRHSGPPAPLVAFAAGVHRAAPRLPVVLAATSANAVDMGVMAAAGIQEVVQWPLIATEVATALARALARPALPVRAGG